MVYISDMSCKLSFLTATDRIQFLYNEVNNFCPQWKIQLQIRIMWRKNLQKESVKYLSAESLFSPPSCNAIIICVNLLNCYHTDGRKFRSDSEELCTVTYRGLFSSQHNMLILISSTPVSSGITNVTALAPGSSVTTVLCSFSVETLKLHPCYCNATLQFPWIYLHPHMLWLKCCSYRGIKRHIKTC